MTLHASPDRDDPLTAGARAFHDQTQVYRAAIWGAPIQWEDLSETTQEALRQRVKPIVEAALEAVGGGVVRSRVLDALNEDAEALRETEAAS